MGAAAGLTGKDPEVRGHTATATARPAAVAIFIVLAVIVHIARAFASDISSVGFPQERPLAVAAVNLFRFAFPTLFLVAMGVGLWNRLRWVWIAAIAWQLLEVSQGAFNIWINEYGPSFIIRFTQIGFYHGALPIVAGVVGLILLLWPSTRRWMRSR